MEELKYLKNHCEVDNDSVSVTGVSVRDKAFFLSLNAFDGIKGHDEEFCLKLSFQYEMDEEGFPAVSVDENTFYDIFQSETALGIIAEVEEMLSEELEKYLEAER